MAKEKLHRLSKVKPIAIGGDTAKEQRALGGLKAFDVLMEAQYCWDQMDRFRHERERNKRYTFGDQWGDKIKVDGKWQTEEDYIKSEGNVPLKNNLLRKLVRNVNGVWRNQANEPICIARDRQEQKLGETMSTVLQCNFQLNQMEEMQSRLIEEFLISGLAVVSARYNVKEGKKDCWIDVVPPNSFFIDPNMRDPRGFDCEIVGEIHDVSLNEILKTFAHSASDRKKLIQIYQWCQHRDFLQRNAEEFGYSRLENYDFLLTSEPGRCRYIEVWKREGKGRYLCHDYNTGSLFKIEEWQYDEKVTAENNRRIQQGLSAGMQADDIPLIEAEAIWDTPWHVYYLTPFGDVLLEEETPYWHESHPYVFKCYPFIDGEIHSFIADVIDQQRYVNRLITLYDWVMRSSAKGLLMFPEDSIPDSMNLDEIADEWHRFNGMIIFKPSPSKAVPQQIANNCTNIGIEGLLQMQMKLVEDISGVNQAIQGKTEYAGMSAAMFNQQTQNATNSLADLFGAFTAFVLALSAKVVKLIQQYYTSKQTFNIVGKNGEVLTYDPAKCRDVEYDLSITESKSTPAYRQRSNVTLEMLWQAGAIDVEQLLQHGDYPFSEELLQDIKSRREEAAQQGQALPPAGQAQPTQGRAPTQPQSPA